MTPLSRKCLRLALMAPLLGLWIVSSCALQGEGERCDHNGSGDADCSGSLRCIKAGDLRDHSVDRCCPANGSFSDQRCQPASGIGGTGGTGGTGGAAGASSGGAAGTDAAAGASGAAGSAGADAAAD